MAYSSSSAVGGSIAGLMLGLSGSLLPGSARPGLVSILALGAVMLGGRGLLGRPSQPFQCDRETPQRWLHLGPLRWAIRNGLTLGCGTSTRIGFWLWYAIPVGSLLLGSPILGVMIYGTFGLVRGLAPVFILGLGRRRPEWDFSGWLVSRARFARVLTSGNLLLLGVSAILVTA